MARYTRLPGVPRSYNRRITKGRTFRRGNKMVRYVYRGSKRIGLEVVRHIRRGMGRYIADKTYRYARKRWK